METPAQVEQMLNELNVLDQRIGALDDFMQQSNLVYLVLDSAERTDMAMQRHYMRQYRWYLNSRVERAITPKNQSEL